MNNEFTVGQQVTWSSQAGGFTRTKTGPVEQVVAPGGMPDRTRFPQLSKEAAAPRDHQSYVIVVPGKTAKSAGKAYWPRVAALQAVAVA